MDDKTLCAELLWDIRERAAGKAQLTEMTTNSVYIAPRYCTRCCREWGSLDVFLDIRARRTGLARTEIWRGVLDAHREELARRQRAYRGSARAELPEPDLRGPCCTTCVLAPQQHVICDEWGQSMHLIKADLGGPQPSKVSVGARRPFPAGTERETELPPLLTGDPTLSSMEALVQGARCANPA